MVGCSTWFVRGNSTCINYSNGYLIMKIFGHPLHMMLIHFPTALLPMDFLLSFFAYYNKDSSFLTAAFYCLAGGVLAGGLAIITGLIDLLLIQKIKNQRWERL